jgi:hypothetical protein
MSWSLPVALWLLRLHWSSSRPFQWQTSARASPLNSVTTLMLSKLGLCRSSCSMAGGCVARTSKPYLQALW